MILILFPRPIKAFQLIKMHYAFWPWIWHNCSWGGGSLRITCHRQIHTDNVLWCDTPAVNLEPPLTRWRDWKVNKYGGSRPRGQSLLRYQPVCLWYHYMSRLTRLKTNNTSPTPNQYTTFHQYWLKLILYACHACAFRSLRMHSGFSYHLELQRAFFT